MTAAILREKRRCVQRGRGVNAPPAR